MELDSAYYPVYRILIAGAFFTFSAGVLYGAYGLVGEDRTRLVGWIFILSGAAGLVLCIALSSVLDRIELQQFSANRKRRGFPVIWRRK